MDQVTKLSNITQRYMQSASSFPVFFFSSFIVSALILGWQANLNNYITAESGIGYYLGIAGGSMMLVMLLYSVRKRFRFMKYLFATKYWFRMHMMFGVLGPTCILYHCGFSLGSTNSNIALFCMLVVSASGLVGRYIYRQIHYGLYGSKTTAAQLREDFSSSHHEIESLFELSPDIEQKLFRINISDLEKQQTIFRQFFNLFSFSIKGRIAYFLALRSLAKSKSLLLKQGKWNKHSSRSVYANSKKKLSIYYATIRKIVGFQFYERMFSLWHVLHIPLFIMMLLSGITHVFAVHLY